MPLFNITTLVGFGFGAALTIILLSLSIQKQHKRYDDYAFGIALLSSVLWFGGNFLSMLLTLLFGTVAKMEAGFAELVASFGMAVLPSSLIHLHLAILFVADKQVTPALTKPKLAAMLVLYIPAIVFIASAFPLLLKSGHSAIAARELLVLPFSAWVFVSIISSILISERLVRIIKNDADRRFHKSTSHILAAIAGGLVLVYFVPLYRIAYIGAYLNLVMLLSPALPAAVLLYYVYRYNFYRLVDKPSLIYSVLYGLVMAVYLLGIRRIGEYLARFPEVKPQFIEGILLVALVFAFQPFRTRIQNRLDKLFFKDRYYYQQFLRELSDSISEIMDLHQLLQTLSQSLTSTLKARACTLIVFRVEDGEHRVSNTYGEHSLVDIDMLIESLRVTRHLRLRRQMRDHRVVPALRRNGIDLAIPVYFQDVLVGLLCLTEKKSGASYSDEELDVMQTFANQIGLAFENARLIQDRIDLEAKVYKTEKMTSLGQLAMTIAHEVKNPLSSINSIIQVLHESAAGEQREDLAIVVNEINRLNTVLEKLLSFARHSNVMIEEISPVEIVNDVVALLKHQARKSRVDIKLVCADQLPTIRADKQSLREIVFNLVFNAIQAMPSGGQVSIELLTRKSLDRSDMEEGKLAARDVEQWLQIKIADTGKGISAADLEKIFNPFYSTKSIGTGLGLTIVRRNVNNLNGHLKVQSRLDEGTVFMISIPASIKRENDE